MFARPLSVPCQINRLLSATIRFRSTTSRDQDFIHKTTIPTLHFQNALLTLPLPKLEETIPRYLRAQRPLLNDEEYSRTEKLAHEYQNGQGKDDHKDLMEKWKADKKNGTSYITGPWFEMYLKDRRAVALNHNPFMAFKDDPRTEYMDQLTRASNFLYSSMRFWKTYRNMQLTPMIFETVPAKSNTDQYRRVMKLLPPKLAYYLSAGYYKAYPLDMSQFPRLMNSTRIPRFEEDELFSNYDSRDVLVLRNGHYYTFPVIDTDGMIIPAAEVKAHLKYILDDPSPPNEFPVGIMTSQDRDTWTVVRRKLVEAGNDGLLHKLDSAAFALVLDDDVTDDPTELSKLFLHGNDGCNRYVADVTDYRTKLSKLFLHGNDGCNRWFDKSVSVILTKSGRTSVNFEHSWGDGVAVLRYFNEVFDETTKRPFVHPDTAPAAVDSATIINKLEFNLTDEIKDAISKAKADFKAKTDSLDLHLNKQERFGAKDLKQKNFGADAFMQLAIQRAYFRLYGETAATYESCSTSGYKHGRTETVRPCTNETLACSQLFENHATSVADLEQAMRACDKQHRTLTLAALQGQGFDRHLFAMKDLALKHGQQLHDFYRDAAYSKINHVILSTSTLASPAVQIGGFCPVVPDGYGIGYSGDSSSIGCVVTTYPQRDGAQFVDAYMQSLQEQYDVLNGVDSRKK